MLELVHVSPNWRGALSVALVRPTGVPERRHGEDPWEPGPPSARAGSPTTSPGSATLDDPEPNGLHPLPDGNVVVTWVPDDDCRERLRRLRDRAVLEAAGFRLFEHEGQPRLSGRQPRLALDGRSSCWSSDSDL